MSLRQQLIHTSVGIVEIVPPAVNTDLGGVGLHTFGEPLDDFADHVIGKLYESDENTEFGYKNSEAWRVAGPQEREKAFEAMNSRH